MRKKRIAIACQGGGTHAAFTWGVLTRILQTKRQWDADGRADLGFDIVAISGTSAGALCALAVWYGLTPNKADPQCGSINKAVERLDFLWTNFAAKTPIERSQNMFVGALINLKERGAPLPESNPYTFFGDMAAAGLSLMGARQQYLSFPALLNSLCPHFDTVDWAALAEQDLRVLVGAIEVLSGNFEVFDSNKSLEDMELRPLAEECDRSGGTRWKMRRPFSLQGVAASGTLPEVLRAERIEDTVFPSCTPGESIRRDAFYWDGLYSQNPPVREFLDLESKNEKPDEIWVIRINPQEMPHSGKAPALEDIGDRKNELTGNISLNQELDHIVTLNKWIAAVDTEHPFLLSKKHVAIRTIKMRRETAWELSHTSKFNRDLRHLRQLRMEGHEVAGEWLKSWRALADEFDNYPDDARYK